MSFQGLHALKQDNIVRGLLDFKPLKQCEACIYGKQTKFSFPFGKACRANKKSELVHVNLRGPM